MDTRADYLQTLQRSLTGHDITDAEWDKIIPHLSLLKLKKGDFLEQAGDVPNKVAFIVSGICRYFCFDESGNERTTVFRRKGEFISGYTSHLEGLCSKLSIQALEDSCIFYITIEQYEKLLRQSESWRMFAFKQGMKVIIEKERREMDILNTDAETRYRKFTQNFPGLEQRVNHYHIASYLGMSNVTLSRIRRKLKAESSSAPVGAL